MLPRHVRQALADLEAGERVAFTYRGIRFQGQAVDMGARLALGVDLGQSRRAAKWPPGCIPCGRQALALLAEWATSRA